jgi:transcriptional regulator with XRE-family HTH domain
MNPFANFGRQLCSLRIQHGWTQQELADRVNKTVYKPGIKQPHIAGLEKSKGKKLPSVPLLAALAEVFEVDMQTLVGTESNIVSSMGNFTGNKMDKEKTEIVDDLPSGQKNTPGKRLRLLRKLFGIKTQADLAEALTRRGANIQHSTVSRLESDDVQPSLETLEAIASEFGVSLDWLRCRTDKLLISAPSADDLLASLSSEDQALVLAVISRLRQGVDMTDSDWQRLSQSVAATGDDMIRSSENDLDVFLE